VDSFYFALKFNFAADSFYFAVSFLFCRRFFLFCADSLFCRGFFFILPREFKFAVAVVIDTRTYQWKDLNAELSLLLCDCNVHETPATDWLVRVAEMKGAFFG